MSSKQFSLQISISMHAKIHLSEHMAASVGAACEEGAVPLDGQPSLREQLSPLTLEQMEERLEEVFARVARVCPPDEQACMGFKKRRKEELLDELCAAYAAAAAADTAAACASGAVTSRKYRRLAGVPLKEVLTAAMLSALKLVDWTQNTRPGVESGYIAVHLLIACHLLFYITYLMICISQ